MASVAQQLQAKLTLEKIFRPEVVRVFSAILNDFRVTVTATGQPVESFMFNSNWLATLDKHYKRVQKTFKGVGVQKKQTEDEEKEELLALALLTWRQQNSVTHANLLTHTTRLNMNEALNDAREQLHSEGNVFPSNRELALVATAILRKKFSARVSSIIMSETQTSAESTKFIEVEVESGELPRILGGGAVVSTTKKVWRTVGDSKVRPIHRTANGQSRLLHVPFVVNGEFLMFPGDSSIGASAGNVINCRCVAQYSL